MEFNSINDIVLYLDRLELKTEKKVFTYTAETAITQKKEIILKLKYLQKLLESRFQKNSLTYSKFDFMISSASKKIIKNYEDLANEVFLFNENEYKLLQAHDSNIEGELKYKKLKIMDDEILAIQEILKENEKILLSLNKLVPELVVKNKLKQEFQTDKEVNKIIEELKLYQ